MYLTLIQMTRIGVVYCVGGNENRPPHYLFLRVRRRLLESDIWTAMTSFLRYFIVYFVLDFYR